MNIWNVSFSWKWQVYFHLFVSYGIFISFFVENFPLTLEVLTKQWYIENLARIRINAFRIELAAGGLYGDLLALAAASVEAEAAVGNAVYMLPSFYNHDCGKLSLSFSACC